MDKYKVYKHTSPSGKVYIGITKRGKAEDRWKYGNGYKHNPYFFNAVQKYGWNNITHEILALNLTLEEACSMEKELIALYTSKGICYNIAEGGTDGNTYKRTEEQKKQLKYALKEYYKTHEHPFKGKHHSNESIRIMKDRSKKLWRENYDKMYSQVIVKIRVGVFNILTQAYQEFNSEKEAATVLGIKETTLRRHVDEGGVFDNHIIIPIDKLTFEEALAKAYNREKLNIHCGGQEIPVLQLTLEGQYIATYPSIKQAAIDTGLNESGIGGACNNKQKQSSGYFWMFESKYLQYKSKGILELEINRMKDALKRRKKTCSVYILQSSLDGVPIDAYISGKQITRKLGYDSSLISKCCNGKLSKVYGYKWKHITKEEYDEYKNILDAA